MHVVLSIHGIVPVLLFTLYNREALVRSGLAKVGPGRAHGKNYGHQSKVLVSIITMYIC